MSTGEDLIRIAEIHRHHWWRSIYRPFKRLRPRSAELAAILSRVPTDDVSKSFSLPLFEYERPSLEAIQRTLGRATGWPDAWSVFALASLDPNGFVREAALTLLQEQPAPEALPYILSRTQDHVAQVRAAAERAFAACFPLCSDRQLFSSLPVADQLLRNPRASTACATSLLERVASFPDDLLLELLNHSRVLSWILQQLFVRRSPRMDDAIRIALRSNSLALQLEAVRGLASLAAPARAALIPLVLADVQGRVRAAGLESIPPEELGEEALERALADRSSRVRAVARGRLQARSSLSIRARYLSLLRSPRASERAIGLSGLLEMKSEEDAAEAALLVDDPSPQVRRTALRFLSKYSPLDAAQAALVALDDPSAKVFRSAVAICAAHPSRAVEIACESLLQSRSDNPQRDRLRRESGLRLLMTGSIEHRLTQLALLLDEPEPERMRDTFRQLYKVVRNHVGVRPLSKALLERVANAVERNLPRVLLGNPRTTLLAMLRAAIRDAKI